MSVRISASGDTAVVVEFGNEVSVELSSQVLSADATVIAANISGVIETIPSFRSLMVQYDPLLTTAAEIIADISPLMDNLTGHQYQARKWCVPVCYEEEYAADITNVAAATGHTVDQVVKMHSDVLYHVYMLGFLPGFPYLGDLPEALHLPRLTNPRTRVPKGSISIATSLTSIYPFESPGGWHLIGTTPLNLFDVSATPPVIFAPGDQVKFKPVSAAEFINIKSQISLSNYCLKPQAMAS